MKEDDLIRVMDSFVGIKENPPGSNRTPIGEEYDWNGVAWCAQTISVACRRLGFPLHEAAVISIERHARTGDWGMGWTRTPTRGAAVCFDWKGNGNPSDMHTGIMSSQTGQIPFRTIEGNYRDQCTRVLRDMKFVRGFATFPFDNLPVISPPSQPVPQPSNQKEDSDLVSNLPTLQRGSTGQAVKNLQGLLKAANRPLEIDGDFQGQTETQLMAWQRDANVPGGPDGVCGTNSWRWLLGLH